MSLTMQEVLERIDTAIPKVTNWKRDRREEKPSVAQHKPRAFTGDADGWHFVIVDFDLNGTRGHDGAARSAKEATVCRLTKEQAKRAVELAQAQIGGN